MGAPPAAFRDPSSGRRGRDPRPTRRRPRLENRPRARHPRPVPTLPFELTAPGAPCSPRERPMAADPSRPFIYVMKDLRKVVPPKREILKGIWLSFYYGAKIGVLGANGAGKSSLLRIMAGA